MTGLPSDEEIRRQLVDVRANVLAATRELRSPRRSTRARTARNLVIAGIAGLGLSAAAVAITVLQADTAHSVQCYPEADTSSEPTLVVYGGPQGEGYWEERVHPVELCSYEWSVGTFTPEGPDDYNPTHPVPPLATCVQSNGEAAVFPNREELTAERLCGTLGLAVWDPESGV